jgi:hypothetical protein
MCDFCHHEEDCNKEQFACEWVHVLPVPFFELRYEFQDLCYPKANPDLKFFLHPGSVTV